MPLPLFFLVEESFDTLFGSFLELLVVDAYLGDFLVGGQDVVQLLTVLLHHLGYLLIGHAGLHSLVKVGIYQSYQLIGLRDYHRLVYKVHVVQMVLNLLGVDVLARRTKNHALAAALNEYVAVLVHYTQVAGVHPAFGVDGLLGQFLVLVITQHHVGTAADYLAGNVLGIGTQYLDLHVGHGLAA